MGISGRSPFAHAKWVFLFALFAGMGIRAFLILQEPMESFGRYGSDDQFYYTQIAGHLAGGEGFTFDGDHATNGFQPLYLALLTPFGKWMLHDWQSALRISWLLISLLTLLSALALRRWLAGIGYPLWGALGGALLMLHPKLLSVTFSGTEAALSLLFVILSLSEVDRLSRQNRGYWRASLVFSGLILARLDLSILLFILAGYLNWSGIPRTRIARVMALPFLVLATWLTINFVSTGYLLPGSGIAKSLHAEMLYGEAGIFGYFQPAVWLSGLKTAFLAESGLSIFSIVLLALSAGLLLRRMVSVPLHPPVLTGVAGLLILSAAVYTLGAFRPWYLMPLFLSLGLLLTVPVLYLAGRREAAMWLILPLCGILWWEAQSAPRVHHGPAYVEAAENLKHAFRPGDRVGSYNSGIIGTVAGPYLSVVNLDGVVNSEVIPALRSGQLGAYLDHAQIDGLLDHKGSLQFFSRFDAQGLGEWYIFDMDMAPHHPETQFRMARKGSPPIEMP